jgi:uncharacterized protein with GYD domain
MPGSRDFVFLLKLNHADVSWIAENFQPDMQHWGGKDCQFFPVSGMYDLVVLAKGGTHEDALKYALYLTRTGRYTTTTLTVFSTDEFKIAAGLEPHYEPHRK